MNFSWIGHDDLGPVGGQETTHPGAVRAGLHGHRSVRKLAEEFQQRWSGVGEEALANDLTRSIEHASKVALIAQVQAKGETTHGNRSG